MCLGIPGQIVEITDAVNLFGIVSVSGVRREINLACVVNDQHPIDSCKGDWVLVHVGFAMSRIDEAEAARTLRLLAELGEMQQQLEAMQPDGMQPEASAAIATQALRHA
jgi:hydrogenase expression/formation protein HypC